MDEAAMAAAGWQRLPTRAFSIAIGPTWMRGEPGRRTVGLITHEGITNDHTAFVHGGALMTFADIALGVGAGDAFAERHFVTAQLQYHFVGAVAQPRLLTCEPELVRKTSQLVFLRGLFKVGDETVGSADGIFKAVAPRG